MKVGGQMTIMAALSMTLVVSFVLAAFQSVNVSMMNLSATQACNLAVEAVFAGYSNVALDEFDILLLKKTDLLEPKLCAYIEDNIEGSTGLTFVDATFDELHGMTDAGGVYIREEILAYMKYGVLSDGLKQWLNSEEEIKKSEKLQEITEEITECEDAMWELDAKTLGLIPLIEGIKTGETGLVIEQGKPQAVPDYFVKAAIYGDITMSHGAVDNQLVFDAVNHMDTYYTDVKSLVEDMRICIDELSEVGDAVSNQYGANSYSAIYKRDYEKLEAVLTGCSKKTEEALQLMGQYEEKSQNLEGKLAETKESVEQGKEILGQELWESILTDIGELQQGRETAKGKLCDMASMKEALLLRKATLTNALAALKKCNVTLKQEQCAAVKADTLALADCLAALTNQNLKFDYSGVDFSQESTGLSTIKKLYETLTDGLLGLVLEGGTYSEKSNTIKDLAAALSGDDDREKNLLYESVDTALYDQYVLDRFQAYTDCLNEEGVYDKEKEGADPLAYSVEYILCGKDSDEENLKETMVRLSLVREGANLAYLLTDTEKKNQALALATTLLGFTGNYGIIKGGQYLILTVWAYGEAIMDLRKLYQGKSVELIKKKENWSLSLENLLRSNFQNQSDKEEKGLSYKDYLRMLLFLENSVEKQYQTMAAMELRFIGKGYTDFRMRDYVCGAAGQAVFQRKGMNGFYTRELQYTYL